MRAAGNPGDGVVDVAWSAILFCVVPLALIGVAYAAGATVPAWLFVLALVGCGIAAVAMGARLVHRSRSRGRS